MSIRKQAGEGHLSSRLDDCNFQSGSCLPCVNPFTHSLFLQRDRNCLQGLGGPPSLTGAPLYPALLPLPLPLSATPRPPCRAVLLGPWPSLPGVSPSSSSTGDLPCPSGLGLNSASAPDGPSLTPYPGERPTSQPPLVTQGMRNPGGDHISSFIRPFSPPLHNSRWSYSLVDVSFPLLLECEGHSCLSPV